MSRPAIGRNEPCPCGSGRKFTDCCRERGFAKAHGADLQEFAEDLRDALAEAHSAASLAPGSASLSEVARDLGLSIPHLDRDARARLIVACALGKVGMPPAAADFRRLVTRRLSPVQAAAADQVGQRGPLGVWVVDRAHPTVYPGRSLGGGTTTFEQVVYHGPRPGSEVKEVTAVGWEADVFGGRVLCVLSCLTDDQRSRLEFLFRHYSGWQSRTAWALAIAIAGDSRAVVSYPSAVHDEIQAARFVSEAGELAVSLRDQVRRSAELRPQVGKERFTPRIDLARGKSILPAFAALREGQVQSLRERFPRLPPGVNPQTLVPLAPALAAIGADPSGGLAGFSEDALGRSPARLLDLGTGHALWVHASPSDSLARARAVAETRLEPSVRAEVEAAWSQLVIETRWLATFVEPVGADLFDELMQGFAALFPPSFLERPVPPLAGAADRRFRAALGVDGTRPVRVGDLPTQGATLWKAKGFGVATMGMLVTGLLELARTWRGAEVLAPPPPPPAEAEGVLREGLDELAALFPAP